MPLQEYPLVVMACNMEEQLESLPAPALTQDEQKLTELLENCMRISSQSIRDQLSQKFAT
jgi:hypothetical protein